MSLWRLGFSITGGNKPGRGGCVWRFARCVACNNRPNHRRPMQRSSTGGRERRVSTSTQVHADIPLTVLLASCSVCVGVKVRDSWGIPKVKSSAPVRRSSRMGCPKKSRHVSCHEGSWLVFRRRWLLTPGMSARMTQCNPVSTKLKQRVAPADCFKSSITWLHSGMLTETDGTVCRRL